MTPGSALILAHPRAIVSERACACCRLAHHAVYLRAAPPDAGRCRDCASPRHITYDPDVDAGIQR